ncbi:hypothetical protein IRJ41_006242 [Triplophysa rosa]|uniref:Uncharacterized protein n=1 Tax=Triplophysa rosa TaxID=992332 RepID=A0A9W8C6M2_TRIRA|nr:hypothetical protein IRJ41_006242 [Triplophysa rosa]
MAAGGDEAVQPYMFEPESDTEGEASEQAVQVRIGQDVSTWWTFDGRGVDVSSQWNLASA